jgi:Zn-dependent protease
VQSLTPELIRNCRSCGRELIPGSLACESCHQLVYSQELDRLANVAKALEAQGRLLEAREQWLMGLPLLPKNSKQAQWIEERAKALNVAAANQAPQPEGKWEKRVGPLGVLGLLLLKGKTLLFALFKLKFLFSFASFIAIYWALYGAKFGIGFAVMILIHEMGHYVDVKRRGLPAEVPVFLPGFGAYVKWNALNVPLDIRSEVSLAGPFAGWLAAAACLGYWFYSGSPVAGALAYTGAWLNVLNLIPVWALDGGHATEAISRNERGMLLAASLGLWFLSGEVAFFLVSLGFGWRMFTKDFPPSPSRSTTLYYVFVLALLAGVMYVAPHRGGAAMMR